MAISGNESRKILSCKSENSYWYINALNLVLMPNQHLESLLRVKGQALHIH